jgi:hypothetical protein
MHLGAFFFGVAHHLARKFATLDPPEKIRTVAKPDRPGAGLAIAIESPHF